MNFSMYAMAVETFVPMLRTLSGLLDQGGQYARAKGFDPAVLIDARLAPDMYPLVKQVQIACDQAHSAAAQLLGEEAPAFEYRERTLDELKVRIARTIEKLQAADAAAYRGAEDRAIQIPLPNGEAAFEMTGFQYVRDWALPHFYFHVVTAYDILRHNGVEIGKRDYLSHAGRYIRQRPAR